RPKTLRRHSLADDVADELRRRVVQGEFLPGQRLPTGSELALSFGVSMSVVREAMSRLKHDGLIQSIQGVGAFVSKSGETRSFRLDSTAGAHPDLGRIFELRRAIEGEAAHLAAVRRTDEHLRRMRSALSEMEQAVTAGADGADADARFHQVVAEATGNPLFADMYAFLSTHIRLAIETARTHSAHIGAWQEAHDEHIRIFQALEAGSSEQARQAILDHIGNAASRLGLAPLGSA
nr:FadR family transcriptional regulator [Pseudomonas sp.]